MPINLEFQIPPGSDKEYLDAFEKMREEGKFCFAKATFAPFGELAVAEIPKKEVQEFLALGQQIINDYVFHFPNNWNVRIHRPKLNDSIFNTVTVTAPDGTDKFQFATFVATIQKHLSHTTLFNIGNLLGPSATKHFEAREAALHRLELMQSKMLEDIETERSRREGELHTKEAALEAKYEAKLQELDREIKARQQKQDERESKLDAERTELDDRAAKHARRQHYKDIKTKFDSWSKTFEVTAGTSQLRKTVFIFTSLLLVIFGGAAAWFLLQTFSFTDTTHLVWTIAKQIAFSLLFVSTAAFFIKWNNQWFQRHADEEFRLKRMELDIDRASWFVEMAFEWKDEKGESIPPELIDRLTHGLFKEEGKEGPVEPAESILHMLLGAARAKLKLADGIEAEYDRRDIGKMARSVRKKNDE